MIVQVWQATDRVPQAVRWSTCAARWYPDAYEHVATVKGDSNYAVYRTNTVEERAWTLMADEKLTVEKCAEGGCRSTSVGDVLVCTHDGRIRTLVVAPLGFEDLETVQQPVGVRPEPIEAGEPDGDD